MVYLHVIDRGVNPGCPGTQQLNLYSNMVTSPLFFINHPQIIDKVNSCKYGHLNLCANTWTCYSFDVPSYS